MSIEFPIYQLEDLLKYQPGRMRHYVINRVSSRWLKEERRYECLETVYDHGISDSADQEATAAVQEKFREIQQQAFDAHVRGRKLTRYISRSFVSISERDALRRSEIDNTPWEQVEITPDVEIIHQDRNFTYWSDGKITKSVPFVPCGGPLSDSAVKLIREVRGADGGFVEGGLEQLTRVKQILSETTRRLDDLFNQDEIVRMRVRWQDDTESYLFIHWSGYPEGYMYDVYQSLESLVKNFQPGPGPQGITDFPPDDFRYDSKLGFVSTIDD